MTSQTQHTWSETIFAGGGEMGALMRLIFDEQRVGVASKLFTLLVNKLRWKLSVP